MDNSPRRKSLSVLYTLSLLTVIAIFLLPLTRWIATSQIAANFAPLGSATSGWLRHTMGVKEDRQMDTEALNTRILTTASLEPEDYGLQYAAIIMTPDLPADTAKPIDDFLFRLSELCDKFRTSPRVHADFLRQASRNMSIGRNARQEMASDYVSATKNQSSYRPAIERAQLLSQMMESANAGIDFEPDNAFFHLMKSVVHFAQEDDQSAISELHTAALCTRYNDYVVEEATDLTRLAEKAFGKQSVISDITQGASILLPQYAQIRGATRLAVVSAIEHEANEDIAYGLAVCEDIIKVGRLLRTDSRLIIGNLVGAAIQETARIRLGGVPQIAPGQESDWVAPDSFSRMTAYLYDVNRRDLAQLVLNEENAAQAVRKLSKDAIPHSIFDGTKLVRLGASYTVGNILLANVLWLTLFGGLATFLLKRKMKSPRPALLMLACWFGIALFYSWYNAPNQVVYGSAVQILHNLTSDGRPMDSMTDLRGFSLLSMAIPFGIVLLTCGVSLFSRVPVSLGILRGLHGLCVPTAAVLILLWVPLTIGIAAKERTLHSEYQQMLRHEMQYLSQLH